MSTGRDRFCFFININEIFVFVLARKLTNIILCMEHGVSIIKITHLIINN